MTRPGKSCRINWAHRVQICPDVPGLQAHQGQAKTRPQKKGMKLPPLLWRSIMEIIGYTLIYIIANIYIYIYMIYIYILYHILPITEISGYTWYIYIFIYILPIRTYQWYDPHSMSPSFLVLQMWSTRCRRLGRWTAPICRPALATVATEQTLNHGSG